MPDPTRTSPSGPLRSITRIISVDPPSCVANTTTELAAALTFLEAETDDYVLVMPLSALNAGVNIAYARVSAAGAVQVAFGNHTAGALDPPAQNMMVVLFKNPGSP